MIKRALSITQKSQAEYILQILRHSSLFKELLPLECAQSIGDISQIISVPKGKILTKEKEIGRGFFVLISGALRIYKNTLSGDLFLVSFITSKKDEKFYPLIGELSLIGHGKRTATVIVDTHAQLLYINNQKFESILAQYPEFGMGIYKKMCGILQERLDSTSHDMIRLFNAFVQEISD